MDSGLATGAGLAPGGAGAGLAPLRALVAGLARVEALERLDWLRAEHCGWVGSGRSTVAGLAPGRGGGSLGAQSQRCRLVCYRAGEAAHL